MEPAKDMALKLCQRVGMSTMFGEFNAGMSLPLEVSKKITIELIKAIAPGDFDYKKSDSYAYWHEVIEEIVKL